MSLQPSAQGIASLYRGNPQPLQQSIQKEQKAKPGLPPDLQKLLALQIVNNEKDGFTAQKAMDQLKQMAGPQGQPPTVMASLEQQAKQKLEAQAVQGQQQKQGLQALMSQAPAGPVPAGTPEPEVQPEAQGIDQLPAEFDMAEGGIVAFSSGGDVDSAREQAAAATAQLQSYGLAQRRDDPEGFAAAQAQAMAAKERLRAAEAAYAQEMSAQGMDRSVQATGMPQVKPRPRVPQAPAQDEDNQSAAETARLLRQRGLPQALPSAAAEPQAKPAPAAPRPAAERPAAVGDIAALAKQMQASNSPATAPAADSPAMRLIKERMNLNPETEEAKAIAKRQAAIPQEDLSQYDRMIAELEKRKAEFEAPKAGFDRLAEYLGQIAQGGRGRKWYEAGAEGATRLKELDKSRKTQQFELSKQAIEVAQKKLDTVRTYAKENYAVGDARFNEVYKDKLAAAKDVVANETAATKLAKEETLKYFELAQNATLEREKMRSQERNANAGRPFDIAGEYAKAVMAGDTKKANALKGVLSTIGEAKRPGADTAQVEKFEKSNLLDLMTMRNLQKKPKLTPEEQQKLQKLQQDLANKAAAQQIEPSQIGINTAPAASSSGIDLSKWGNPTKN